MNISFGLKLDFKGLAKFNLLFKGRLKRQMKEKAKDLLKYSVYGSSRVPEKAPVDFGVLRQTASVFVDAELQKVSDFPVKPEYRILYKPAIADTQSGNTKYLIMIVFNAPYADKMHEIDYNPGARSIGDKNSNPGNQWLRKHLLGDGAYLVKQIGIGIKAEVFG